MSITFSTDDYYPPDWSAMPKFQHHLQVIKDGTIMGNINIKMKQFVLIGRVPDLCDLVIDNPSVSRKHAILQFKSGQKYGYLYDLGGTHGTEVNRVRLPARAYQQVKPFDIIKFGVSSRYYVIRCPSLQHQQQEQQDQADNKFQQIIAQRKIQLSKQQMKQKYYDLLQNDPYFKSNSQAGRKLQGGIFSDASRNVNGVDWGISDQYQVYSYRNQSQFQLQPEILRRLPGLDQQQLDKIAELQVNLRKYQQTQSQLNQLVNRQKRQYGLQDKLRDKKQKLQKRFVQSSQALQKSQDWVRVNLFGQKQVRITKKQRAKRDDDTFQDDQFLDRTLKNKIKQPINDSKQQAQKQMFTVQDFWKLQKQLRSLLRQLKAIQKQQINDDNGNQTSKWSNFKHPQKQQKQNNEDNHQQTQQIEQKVQQRIEKDEAEQDQLDMFMKQNNQNIKKQQKIFQDQKKNELIIKINNLKQNLASLIGFKEVQKIQDEEKGVNSKVQSQQQRKIRKDRQSNNKITDILNKLDVIKQMEEDLDEDDIKIFDYYKNRKIEEDEDEKQINQRYKRNRADDLQNEAHSYEDHKKKIFSIGNDYSRDKDKANDQQQQDYVDLTKLG